MKCNCILHLKFLLALCYPRFKKLWELNYSKSTVTQNGVIINSITILRILNWAVNKFAVVLNFSLLHVYFCYPISSLKAQLDGELSKGRVWWRNRKMWIFTISRVWMSSYILPLGKFSVTAQFCLSRRQNFGFSNLQVFSFVFSETH